MGRIRGHWNSLSGEAKLGVVVMPIILALLAGVVSPLVVKRLSQEPAPERRGVVKILDVETNVPLSDFSAQHAAARLQPQDYVLASVAEGLPAGEQQPAPSDSGAGDLGGGDAGASGVPGDSGDGGEPGGNGDLGENGDPDDGDDSGEGDDPGTGDDPGIDDDPGEDDDPAAGGGSGTGAGPEAGGETKDIDGDGVADADDLCPTSAGNLPNGCRAAQLRTEPFGCTEQDMVATLTAGGAGTERCEDLTAVLGPTTGDAPGEVDERQTPSPPRCTRSDPSRCAATTNASSPSASRSRSRSPSRVWRVRKSTSGGHSGTQTAAGSRTNGSGTARS